MPIDPNMTSSVAEADSVEVVITSDGHSVEVPTKDGQRFWDSAEDELFFFASEESSQLHCVETKAVLDGLLPYLAQDGVEPFDLEQPIAWKLIEAFHRHKAERGMDAVAAAVEVMKLRNSEEVSVKALVVGYLFASNFWREGVQELARVIAEHRDVDEFSSVFVDFTDAEGVSDRPQLIWLLSMRRLALLETRQDNLLPEIAHALRAHGGGSISHVELAHVLDLWIESAKCTNVAQLDAFLVKHTVVEEEGEFDPHAYLPWKDLREVLESLPVTIDSNSFG